jgi:SHS family lactate transporter-like MFS transporter
MLDVLLYSLLSFAIAFTADIWAFYIICACFGVAMGGVWGIGASLSLESVKPQARGFVSGLLQSGYPSGYLAASLVYGFLYAVIGWRGMFMVGVLPALALIVYIYFCVPESSHFHAAQARSQSASTLHILRHHWKIALYAIALMTGYNFFSHGTQDLYPTFLQIQHHYTPATVKNIAVIYNIGAILGGLVFGSISQRFGRRRTVMVVALLALPVVYLWAFSTTAVTLGLGAFLMQFCVQGAWGVVPAHLNELSPASARGTFPGTCYQLGNLIASVNAVLQAGIAERTGNYSLALAAVATFAALVIALLMRFGPEAHNVEFGAPAAK